MDFHPKDLPISKTYDVKNENEAVQAVEDMVNLGFKDKNAGYKVLMPKETKIAKRIGYTVTTGVTKGLREKNIIFVHALKNAILPLITIVGLSIPGLIGGSVIAESIFAIPGMGKLFYDSVLMRDFPVIMGILTIGSFLTLIGNLLADVGYAWADPRVRKGLVK